MEISCQVHLNRDPYLIQKMTLRVECEFRNTEPMLMYWFHLMVLFVPLGDVYCVKNFFLNQRQTIFFSFYWTDEPKNVIAEITPLDVKQGQPVTFSCSARGQPYPNFMWFQNGSQVSNLAQWNITSVAPSQNGSYYCVANNTHGEQKSNVMNLIVQCKSVQYFTIWNLFLIVCHIEHLFKLPTMTMNLQEIHPSHRFFDKL